MPSRARAAAGQLAQYALAAGVGSLLLFGTGQLFRLIGGTCTALCQPEFSALMGTLAGVLAVWLKEHPA